MSKDKQFASASNSVKELKASLKELNANLNDLRNTYISIIRDAGYTKLVKARTNIDKEPNIIKLKSTEMKDSTFLDFAGFSLFVISSSIFFIGILLIFNYIDKTNKNHIIETSETIEVNIVNPGNKQIKVNLPSQAEFK